MPSARAHRHLGFSLLAICGLLLVTSLTGCTTTQETAAKKQAESKRFLENRERKREQKKAHDKEKGGDQS